MRLKIFQRLVVDTELTGSSSIFLEDNEIYSDQTITIEPHGQIIFDITVQHFSQDMAGGHDFEELSVGK